MSGFSASALTGSARFKWKLALYGVVVGVFTGLLIVFYRIGIDRGTQTAASLYAFFRLHPVFILPWAAAAAGAGLLIARLVKWEPMASGSGIPETEGVVLFGLKMRWFTVMPVRIFAGILGSFFGLSLGREGPSIQIGGAAGQAAARIAKQKQFEEKVLITSGAAAGLSAAFSAPLSGVMFALEEVHKSFSPVILLSATAAAALADLLTKVFFGLKPVLDFTAVSQLPLDQYGWLIPAGVVSGLAGAVMNRVLLAFRGLAEKIPRYAKPVIAIGVALPCGLCFPLVLGGGENLIRFAEEAKSGILFLSLLLVLKMLFTSTSFSSGIPGGIFMPILAVGTLSGSILGVAASYAGMPARYISILAVCAMAGALSSCVKAPITSILLTAEMSGSLVHLLPVTVCVFLALLVSDLLRTEPIYEALLSRFVMKKSEKKPAGEGGEDLFLFPVELGSAAAGKTVSAVKWPESVLIVNIRRGEKELVPRGSTRILPGDSLAVISAEAEAETRRRMEALCRTGR